VNRRKRSCIASALKYGALHAGIDAIGLIPEAGGIARAIGHQAGYVGVVADHLGANVLKAVGASTGVELSLAGLRESSSEGVLSAGLTVVGFIPVFGQAAAVALIAVDIYKTAKAIGECD
jgi:hypothetical protein